MTQASSTDFRRLIQIKNLAKQPTKVGTLNTRSAANRLGGSTSGFCFGQTELPASSVLRFCNELTVRLY